MLSTATHTPTHGPSTDRLGAARSLTSHDGNGKGDVNGPNIAEHLDPGAEFDYTQFVLRTDRTYPSTDSNLATGLAADPAGVHEGRWEDLLTCLADLWSQFSIPAAGIAAMTGVLRGLLNELHEAGTTLYDASDDDILRFITTNPGGSTTPDRQELRLRRNVVHGAYLALEHIGIIENAGLIDVPALAGDARTDRRGKHRHDRMPERTRNTYDNQVHVRPATHDEVLLTRLASQLVGTSRGGQHLAAAAVALCTSTATTGEAAQVRWMHRHEFRLRLPGRQVVQRATTENDIAPRTITLDPWAAGVLDTWRQEHRNSHRFDPEDSIVYRGDKALDSTSAAVCVDQQVRKAMQRAGLTHTRGLTAGSLRLWAAISDATDPAGVAAGAHRAGIRFTTLHRLTHQLGERAF